MKLNSYPIAGNINNLTYPAVNTVRKVCSRCNLVRVYLFLLKMYYLYSRGGYE